MANRLTGLNAVRVGSEVTLTGQDRGGSGDQSSGATSKPMLTQCWPIVNDAGRALNIAITLQYSHGVESFLILKVMF